jgi:hypothetical protein
MDGQTNTVETMHTYTIEVVADGSAQASATGYMDIQ